MASNLTAPIPGMSLTAEPKSRPWQQPPQYVELDDVVQYYLERMSTEEAVERTNFILEKDQTPVNLVVDSLVTAGMMEGIHTVAMGTLVAPVLREFIIANAEIEGIDFFVSSEDRVKNMIRDPFRLRRLQEDLEKSEMEELEKRAMPTPMEEESAEDEQAPVAMGLIARPQRDTEEMM